MRLALLCLLLGGCNSLFSLDEVKLPGSDLEPGPWAQTAVGDGYQCAIQLDGTLWCWGANDLGQIGLGEGVQATTPMQVGASQWLSVSTHGRSTCGIQMDHTLWCWGANDESQLGDATLMTHFVPTQVPGAWTSVAVGPFHACGVRDTGALACWGRNTSGQTGTGDALPVTEPKAVMSNLTWLSVDVGEMHTCALASDHHVWCWGDSSYSQLGNGAQVPSPIPVLVVEQTYDQITTGEYHSCALRPDRGIDCWGYNTYGQLGDPVVYVSSSPTRVIDSRDDWTGVAAGWTHTCATKSDDSLWCWGNNTSGQLGQTDLTVRGAVPRQVAGGAYTWESVSGGTLSSCAIGLDHNLWCWGTDATAAETAVPTPEQVPGSWRSIAAGGFTMCGIAADQSLACWGYNYNGTVGDGTHKDRTAPVTIAGPAWRTVAMSGTAACALTDANAMYCWGYGYGGFGDGSNSRNVPTRVNTQSWLDVRVSYGSTFGIEAGTNTLWCWGSNTYGACGLGTTTLTPMPTQVGTDLWASVETRSNAFTACGRSSVGLQCWGDGTYGQLGDGVSGSGHYVATPTTVIGEPANGAGPVSVSYTGVCALDAKNMAWCWGSNYTGELAMDSSVSYTGTPVAIPGGPWRTISAGAGHVCAIHEDGTLWCWGSNTRGQLGTGVIDTMPVRTPTQVSTATTWEKILAADGFTCGLRDQGDLWCWGANDYGQLGIGRDIAVGEPRLVLP